MRLEALAKSAELSPQSRRGHGEASGEAVVVVGVRHLEPGRDEQSGEHGEDADGDQRLRPLLPPAHPGHDATASRRSGRGAARAVAEVGEHDLLQVDLVLLQQAS